jgi:HlyD family secretion protein
LAIWYLVRPEPLLVQREAESTRIDIAARVPGRLVKIAAARGQNVEAGATLLVIDNPELIAEWTKPKPVADAELRRISVGTRPEIIAQRTAEIDRETADLTVAQQTYNLTKQLAADKFAPSPSSTSKDLAFLRVDGVTARRLAHLEKVYRLADA